MSDPTIIPSIPGDDAALEAFVVRVTTPGRPPLVPELELLLASEVVPVWQATEVEAARIGLPPPFWAFAWAGGQAIARTVLDRPDLVAGHHVLDFGAGGGIAGIAAARAGAARVAAAEVDRFAGAVMRLNAARAGVRLEVRLEDVVGRDEGWEVVLAGDVCYEKPMAERVLAWLHGLARRGALVLVGDPGRRYCPEDGVVELARYAIPVDPDLEGRTVRETRVLRLG
jgi:predicted nicotinamide N-methyase